MLQGISNDFRAAVQFHKSGDLRNAEAIYRKILVRDPRHADAMHLLGVVAHQVGQHDTAIEWISRAIAIQGNRPAFHCNLGEAYRAVNQLDQARRCFEAALKLNPSMPEAHNNLGNVLNKLGHPDEAAGAFQQAIRLRPNYVEPYNNLGSSLLHRDPRANDATYEQVVAIYRAALQLQPGLPEAHYNLGMVLADRGNTADAADAYREALRLRPDYTEALAAYGNLLQNEGRLEEARGCYERAIQSKPDFAQAHFFLGNIYHLQRQPADAIRAYQQALRLQPNHPDIYINLSACFNELVGQPDFAEQGIRLGLELAPNSPALHTNLAISLEKQGRADEALDAWRRAVELQPNDAAEHSNLLYAIIFHPGYEAWEVYGEHLAWGARHAEPLTALAAPHTNDRTADRRLRIGYVSPHFRRHAVNFFTEPVLSSHDHERFEIFCYADLRDRGDDVTDRLRTHADHWREVGFESDERVAALVREDQIDILVDLTGHIGGNRLLIFARKPAPVQVTYIGYQNTTGMSAMDYRLTDAIADPPGMTDAYYTEKLVRLPDAFFCYAPSPDAPAITPLPALANGYVTFGSFNNYAKVTPPVVDAWLEILARVPHSRLLVLAYRGGYLEAHWHRLAAERGIDPARIELCDKRPRDDYLKLIQQVDIALDPFPFNGHTTTCDTIWMGVPVVLMQGATYASRFGGSVLVNLGLQAWIAQSVEGYVETAVRGAADLASLTRLRDELRPRMASSVLLDAPRFTRNLETAYRQMWNHWRQNPGTPCST